MRKNQRKRSVYGIVLTPLLIMFLVEMTIIIGVPSVSGVLRQLNRNEETLLRQHVTLREKQLENAMGTSWSDLDHLAEVINREAEMLMGRNKVSMTQLQESTEMKDELLLNITDELITEMYIRRVNGIYVVLNTEDLEPLRASGQMPRCSGICIQDMDPDTAPSQRYSDLMFKRAPISVVREMNISTDTDWKPMFVFDPEEDPANYDFLYQPFQEAYRAASAVEDPSHFGYWTLATSRWYGEEDECLVTYSQPLVLEDGTVYGVLGVELREDYFSSLLPHEELVLNDAGAYALAKVSRSDEEIEIEELLVSSSRLDAETIGRGTVLEQKGNGARCIINEEKYYVAVAPVAVYGSESPYQQEDWMLLGLAKEQDLYNASRSTEYTLGVATLMMLIVGLLGSTFIALRLSKPIQVLSQEVAQAHLTKSNTIPKLTKTYIKEMDEFSDAFTALSENLIKTSSRFLKIIEMASSEIGGFEMSPYGEAFFTDNFFPMLGMQVNPDEKLTATTLLERRDQLQKTVPWSKWSDGGEVYEFSDVCGHTRYVKVSFRWQQDGTALALTEDVTALMAERKRIEHDRDYDFLTGLMNRRAFYREVDRVFRNETRGKFGAVVMMDLDELKKMNDKFGHEWGDHYLRTAAWGFRDALPRNALLARLSGDEFCAVFYGFATEEAARESVQSFRESIYRNSFVAPDEGEYFVKVSGGVSWYPKDGSTLPELMKFADFALYQVKHGGRGRLEEFDFVSYNQAIYHAQNRQELQKLIEERLVDYHFQPIFNAKDGTPFAYEALMRVKLPTLHTPIAVLNLAQQENRMRDIERVTMERSTECFGALREKNLVDHGAYLFINSIADQWLEKEEQQRVAETCRDFADRVVIEITEHTEADATALAKKKEMEWFSGMFALDDYGTGYNGEKNLLELAPKFVKLDICLVRGLDADENKQQIVSNLLSFAHQRGMMVIAEGLETMGEIRTALDMGIDLLQGYALARPAEVPMEISPAAMQVIREFHAKENK